MAFPIIIQVHYAFTPHVCRHTFASMHVKQGTDLLMLKELGGWERIESVQRYSHVNTDAKRKAAAKLKAVMNL